jgi:hypothetical protein
MRLRALIVLLIIAALASVGVLIIANHQIAATDDGVTTRRSSGPPSNASPIGAASATEPPEPEDRAASASRAAAKTAMEETDPDHHTVPANLSGVAKTNAAADDAALRERLDILLGQLQDPLNLARATPGADLLAFPPRAAPWFRELLATRSDLTWQARASLARAAALLADPTRGRGADGLMPQSQQDYDAMRDGYRHGQDHDPRWDALVERSFRLVCILWNEDPERRGNETNQALALLQEARRLGCRDSLVFYLIGRQHENLEGDDVLVSRSQVSSAAHQIMASAYNNNLKAMVLLRYALHLWWEEDAKVDGMNAAELQRVMNDLALLLATSIDDTGYYSMMYRLNAYDDLLHKLHPRDEAHAIAAFLAALRAAHPKHPVDAIAQAFFMQYWAWDARGSGWSSSVSDEGWRLMRERMEIARRGLLAALAADPGFTEAYQVLLDLANGLSASKEEAWSWFAHIQERIPGDFNSANSMIDYLEPKWNGSIEEELQLGRSALATGNWETQLAILLDNVHNRLKNYNPDGTWSEEPLGAYFHQETVWKDLETVCRGYLAEYPADDEIHWNYCWFAYAAGHLETARAQFNQMVYKTCDENDPVNAFLLQQMHADGPGSLVSQP